MKNLKELEEIVKNTLSEKRYIHSVNVKDKCVELAEKYGVDADMASLVGMVHDIAKEMSKEEKFKFCKENNLEIDDLEFKNPELLHAKIGAEIAKKEYGFSEEMANAIKYHTTGKAGMDTLAKVLYVADTISDDRNWEGVEEARRLSKINLDETVKYLFDSSIELRLKLNKTIHIDTVEARNEYLDE